MLRRRGRRRWYGRDRGGGGPAVSGRTGRGRASAIAGLFGLPQHLGEGAGEHARFDHHAGNGLLSGGQRVGDLGGERGPLQAGGEHGRPVGRGGALEGALAAELAGRERDLKVAALDAHPGRQAQLGCRDGAGAAEAVSANLQVQGARCGTQGEGHVLHARGDGAAGQDAQRDDGALEGAFEFDRATHGAADHGAFFVHVQGGAGQVQAGDRPLVQRDLYGGLAFLGGRQADLDGLARDDQGGVGGAGLGIAAAGGWFAGARSRAGAGLAQGEAVLGRSRAAAARAVHLGSGVQAEAVGGRLKSRRCAQLVGHLPAHVHGLALVAIGGAGHVQALAAGGRQPVLVGLDHVGQLVGEKLVAGGGARAEGAPAEVDVPADGEGHGVQGVGRAVGAAIGVDPDMAEVVAKGALHAQAHGLGQGLAPALADAIGGLAHVQALGLGLVAAHQLAHHAEGGLPGNQAFGAFKAGHGHGEAAHRVLLEQGGSAAFAVEAAQGAAEVGAELGAAGLGEVLVAQPALKQGQGLDLGPLGEAGRRRAGLGGGRIAAAALPAVGVARGLVRGPGVPTAPLVDSPECHVLLPRIGCPGSVFDPSNVAP